MFNQKGEFVSIFDIRSAATFRLTESMRQLKKSNLFVAKNDSDRYSLEDRLEQLLALEMYLLAEDNFGPENIWDVGKIIDLIDLRDQVHWIWLVGTVAREEPSTSIPYRLL